MSYQDKFGMYHHKPCKNGNPSSNNPWIYTLYAALHGLPVNRERITKYYELCVNKVAKNYIDVQRRPDVKTPPISFDEIIGMYGLQELGLIDSDLAIDYHILKANKFVYKGKGKPLKFSMLEKIVRGIAKLLLSIKVNPFLRKSQQAKMRNVFWRREIEELYQVAYRLHPAFTTMIKRIENKPRHKEEEIVFDFHYENVKNGKNYSQKNILWALLKLNGDEKMARKLKPHRNFTRYFPSDHPIARKYN